MQDFMEPSLSIGATNMFEDNEGAMKSVAANRGTKHIGLKHFLVIDACDAGKVRVVYVRTEYQHANLFTKPLDKQKLHKPAKAVVKIV